MDLQESTVDITSCESEPIRFPGAIQPHGALLVLNEDGVRIEGASETCEHLLKLAPAKLVGQDFGKLFGQSFAASLLADLDEKLSPLVSLSVGENYFWARASRNNSRQVLVDIEPVSDHAENRLRYQCRQCVTELRQLSDLNSIASRAVEILGEITGFDRVMLYRFDADWNGEVIAEAAVAGIASYLGLNFPATDIPKQARELFKSSRMRHIPDALYTPSALVSCGDAKSIDLGESPLRSVSPLHIEYLANMEVRATLVGSLVVDGKLWGLVSCQSKINPKYFSLHERDSLGWFCEDLASLIQSTLGHQKRELEATLGLRRRQLIERMRSTDVGVLAQGVCIDECIDVVNADGFCLQTGDQLQTIGQVPTAQTIRELLRRLPALRGNATQFASNNLARDFGSDLEVGDLAGALFLSLANEADIALIWFRQERRQTLHWGGDPERAHIADATGRTSPRKSFNQFLTTIHGQSLPWLPEELSSASELGSLIEIQRLRESEARFRDLFENNSSAMGLIDPQSATIVDVNQAAANFYGYARAAMRGMLLYRLNVLPMERVVELRTHSLTGERQSFPLQHRLASGEVKDVEVHTTPITSGGRSLMLSIVQDVSKRIQAERSRNEVLSRLKKIASRVPGAVYQCRMRADGSFCFPFASEGIRELFHVSPEEIQSDGSKLFERVHPDDFSRVTESIRHSARTLHRWEQEFRVRYENGTVRWIHGNSIPERDTDGSVLWHGYTKDISDRKASEAELAHYRDRLEELVAEQTRKLEQSMFALSESEEQFRLLALNTSDGLAVIKDRAIVFVSPNYLGLLGFARREDLGNSVDAIQALIHPDDVERVRRSIRVAMKSGAQRCTYAYRLRHKRGHYLWLEDTTRFIFDKDSGQSRFYVVSRDISERVVAESKLLKIAELLEQTGEVAKIGGWELDVESMQVTWSRQIFRIFERRVKKVQTLDQVVACYVPGSQVKMRTALALALEQHAPWDLELEAITDKGKKLSVNSQGRVQSEGGRVLRIYGSVRDITAEVLLRNEIAEHQKSLQVCFDNQQTGVAVFSETELLYCNPSFRSLLGYAATDSLSHLSMGQLASSPDKKYMQARHKRAKVFKEQLSPKLMTLLGKDDEKIKCLVSGSIVSWNGEQRFLASISPIGDSERVELEIRATEERYERLLVAQLENQQAEIARELHDSLGSRLAGVSMLLGGFKQKHPRIGRELAMALEQIQTAAEVSRRLSRGLMPVEASQGAFWRALERLCADYMQMAGVQCNFVMECDCEGIDGVTGNHLYRIAQEAIVNAVRHGHASRIEVRLEQPQDRIVMSVIDNGSQTAGQHPTTHSSSGIGLKSMQARAKSIGAAFNWYVNDLGGITVAILLEPQP